MDHKEIDGVYIIGRIEGVDFTASGEIDGNKYGASVKLKFTQQSETVKKAGSVDLKTKRLVSNIIKIATTDTDLPELVAKYNEKIGQRVKISLATADNSTFGTTSAQIQDLK